MNAPAWSGAVSGVSQAEDGWQFFRLRRSSGTPGAYRIKVLTTSAETGSYATENTPIVICEDADDPFATACLWDVMYADASRNYNFRHAAYLGGNNTEDWYELDIPENRRVSVTATGLRNSSSSGWLDPAVEVHSVKRSLGGNGYYDDVQNSPSKYMAFDLNGGLDPYVASYGYGPQTSSSVHFTANRGQKYRIKVYRQTTTTASGPYTLTVVVHRASLSAATMPPWIP